MDLKSKDNPAPSKIDARHARVPAGQRIYAVGDIHGRLDLLRPLADAIEADDRARGPAQTTIILLGDLIDRGSDSAGVLDFILAWRERRPLRVLIGNHEEVFLDSFTQTDALRGLMPHGARETLLSYGIDVPDTGSATLRRVQDEMAARIPQRHRAFMAALEFGAQTGLAVFASSITDPAIRALAGCVLVFVGVLVAMSLVRLAVRSMVKALGLSLSDRLLGMVFGLARGLLLVMLLVAAGGMTSAPQQHWWKEATLAPPLETAVLVAKPWLPDDLAKKIRFS